MKAPPPHAPPPPNNAFPSVPPGLPSPAVAVPAVPPCPAVPPPLYFSEPRGLQGPARTLSTNYGQASSSSSSPGLPTDAFVDLCRRLASLERTLETILWILKTGASNSSVSSLLSPAGAPNQATSSSQLFPADAANHGSALASFRLTDEEPITESWHWEWGSIPPVEPPQSFHLCFYNDKSGSCPAFTAAVWYVRWASKHSNSFMCDFCAKYFRKRGLLNGFTRVIQ